MNKKSYKVYIPYKKSSNKTIYNDCIINVNIKYLIEDNGFYDFKFILLIEHN